MAILSCTYYKCLFLPPPPNRCPGHNSSLPCWIWIIFHTSIVHDPRVCYDLDQGHVSKVKVAYSSYIHPKPCLGQNSSLPCWILIYITQLYHGLDSGSYCQGQSLHMTTFFLDHYLSQVTWMRMTLHAIVVHDPGVVVAGGIRSVTTCLV